MCFLRWSLLCAYIQLGLAGGTWFSFSTLSTSVDDPLSRSQELSHLPDLTIPPPRSRTPDWALRRFPGVDLSKTCSDFHGHPMARNVGRPARNTLLTDSSLPYLSAPTKSLTWALSGEVLLALRALTITSYQKLSKGLYPLRVCHTRSS